MISPAPHQIQLMKQWEQALHEKLQQTQTEQDSQIQFLRTTCRHVYVEILKACPNWAKQKNIAPRLWSSWYREIEPYQTELKQLVKDHPQGKQIAPIRTKLQELLRAAQDCYADLAQNLRQQVDEKTLDQEEKQAGEYLLHTCCIAQGDLARYAQNLLPRTQQQWDEVAQFYSQALNLVADPSGKVYNQLALLSLMKSQPLETIYLYVRSLTCRKAFSARENLLQILGNYQKLPQYAKHEVGSLTFERVLVKCLYSLVTGIQVQCLPSQIQEVEKVLRELLTSSARMGDDEKDGSDRGLVQPPLLAQVLLKSLVTIIFAIHNNQCSIGTRSKSPYKYHEEIPNWEEKDVLVESLTLGCSFCQALLEEFINTEIVTSKRFLNALLPSINSFLRWLRLHPWYLECDQPFMQQLKDTYIQVVNAVCEKNAARETLELGQLEQMNLDDFLFTEDIKLRGFLPMETRTIARQIADAFLTDQVSEIYRQDEDESHSFGRRLQYFVVFGIQEAKSNTWISFDPVQKSFANLLDTTSSPLSNEDHVSPASDFAVGNSDQICQMCFNSSDKTSSACEFCGFDFSNAVSQSDRHLKSLSSPDLMQSLERCGSSNGILKGVNLKTSNAKASTKKSQHHSSRNKFRKRRSYTPDYADVMALGKLSVKRGDGNAKEKCLIVLDAPNIAMRHGLNKKFSCRGIRLAFDYYIKRGHKVVAFLPDYIIHYEDVGANKRMANAGFKVSPSKLPDDVILLNKMVEEGLIIPTPSQDYDDSYCIKYAGRHNGCVVSNDLYRDHIENMDGPKEQKIAMKSWLYAHRISFTWVGDEFLPNPDFRFPDM